MHTLEYEADTLTDDTGQRYLVATERLAADAARLPALWYADDAQESAEALASGGLSAVSALYAERAEYDAQPVRQSGYISYRAWREGGHRAEEWLAELDGEGTPVVE